MRPVVDFAEGGAARGRRVGKLGLHEDFLDAAHALVERLVELREVLDVDTMRDHAVKRHRQYV